MEPSHLVFLFAKNRTNIAYIIIIQQNVLSISFIDPSIHTPIYIHPTVKIHLCWFEPFLPFIFPSPFPFLHFSYNRIGMECTLQARVLLS